MNAEELFVKEFKAYTKYKEHIISGANFMADGQVAHVMQNLPPQMASYWEREVQRQIPLLKGTALGSEADGHMAFQTFVKSIIPPDFPVIDAGKGFPKYCVVRRVSVPYFSALNNTTVIALDERTYAKRITGNDGKFIKNSDGTAVTRDVDIPAGSKLISSHKNIQLANYTVDEHGRRIKFNADGFGYVDFVDTPQGRRYIYYVPKDFLYKLNLNALVLSSSRLTVKYYWGRRYYFNWGVSSCYLYVAPFVPNIINPNYLAFCLKSSTDFTAEIAGLEAYWQKAHKYGVSGNQKLCPPVLYSLDATSLSSAEGLHEGGDSNLAFYTLPQPERDPYEKIGECLGASDDTPVII